MTDPPDPPRPPPAPPGGLLRWPVATLRSYLVVMILLSTVPIALLMSAQIFGEVKAQQRRMGEDLHRSAAALGQAIGSELAASAETLRILAQTEALQQGELARFQRLVQQRLSARSSWDNLYLLDTAGRELLPADPALADDPARRAAAALRRPLRPLHDERSHVSDLMQAGAPPRLVTAIEVPVMVNGVRRYLLGAWVDVSHWREVLQSAGADAGAGRFAVLVDGERRLIAQTPARAQPGVAAAAPRRDDGVAGRALPPELDRALGRDPRGTVQRSHLPGVDAAYSAWQPVPGSAWHVGVAEPAQPRDQAQQQAVAAALGTAGLCLMLGVGLALRAARRITQPLHQLATQGAGAVSEPVVVHEIALLRDALGAAQARDALARGQLQSQADEFEALFSSSPVGLAFAQDDGCRKVLHNTAMDELLGPAHPGLAGLRVLAAGHELAPAQQPLQRACRGEVVPPTELELQRPDRPARHVIAQAVPLRHAQGTPRGAIVAMLDITGRKQAEARLLRTDERLRESQRLVDLAQEAGRVGFFRYTWTPRTLTWTPGQARLFGLDHSPEDGALWPWIQRIDPADLDRVRRQLQNMLQERRERESFEFRARVGTAGARWLTSRILCSWRDDGAPEQIVGVTVDIHDQKRAEAQRQALTERAEAARLEAEAANRAKDELLAMLGHELRNPLSAIASSVEVLHRTRDGAAAARPGLAQEALAIIARQTRHLARLMDDLLDVGAVISGKVLLSRQPLELAALVQRQVDTLALTGQSREHALALALAPAWVQADATRIEQVVNNLLSNAVKYTPPGTRIAVTVRRLDGEVLLEVRDDGPGIPADLLPRVFDLFVQGERPLDRRSGGLGIGLTLVRRLVDLHGGRVEVQSGAQGTVFTVRLPAIEPPAAAAAAGPAAPARHGARRRRVLVIEDNEDGLQALEAMLSLDGHAVTTARDGHAGLAALLEQRPDVGVVDIGLPGLTGYELARRSRGQGYTGRLIALSGYGQEHNIELARRAGFDAHLVKPVDARRLAELLYDEE